MLLLFSCADDDTTVVEDTTKEQLQQLSGTYMDLEPYAYGEAFGQRIFTFEDGLLYFGERPTDNNMCTADRRPTALTPAVTKI